MTDGKTEEKAEKKEIDENTVFIGTKPFMNYVTAVVMQVTTKNADEIKVLTRGKFTSKAIDVVEVARNRFLDGKNKVVVKNVQISSEKFNTKDDTTGKERQINVSAIEITLVKEKNQ